MTFNVNSQLCRQFGAYCDETKACGSRYKEALYLSYLPISFDDEIKRDSL